MQIIRQSADTSQGEWILFAMHCCGKGLGVDTIGTNRFFLLYIADNKKI